jgi:hypothetical protein
VVTGALLLVSVFVPNVAMFVRSIRRAATRAARRMPPEPALSMPRKDT